MCSNVFKKTSYPYFILFALAMATLSHTPFGLCYFNFRFKLPWDDATLSFVEHNTNQLIGCSIIVNYPNYLTKLYNLK